MTMFDNGGDNLADSKLVIPANRQPGPLSRFFLRHAGGYDGKYYTKEEANTAASLAAAKFVSVSFATFSFMKAVHPAFDVVAPELKGIFMAAAAGGLWWGISKLDTEVMHSMRARRATKYAEENLGIKDPKGGPAWPGFLFRVGISMGSLGISIPALLIAASQGTIDDRIKTNLNNQNAPIVEEYRGRLRETDNSITSLRARLASLQQQLSVTQSPDGILTAEERARIVVLTETLQQATSNMRDKQQELERAQRKRDEAASRMEQEDMGARGSIAGRGPQYLTAMVDKRDAERDINRIQASLVHLQTTINSSNTQMATIRAQASGNPVSGRTDTGVLAQTLQAQIDQVTSDLNKQIALRTTLANVDGLSASDQRFHAFKPDMAQQIDAYLAFMRTDASPMEWSRQIFMTLIIVSLELGVFAMASSRKLNAGELRGHLAEVINSEQAKAVFDRAKERMRLSLEADTDDETIALGKRVAIIRADAKAFTEELNKIEKDPAIRKSYAEQIAQFFEWLGLNKPDPEKKGNITPFRKPNP